MGKRPSVIDDVMLPTPTRATSAEVAEERPAVAPPAAAPRRAARPDVQHTSIYLPRAAYDRLREIAFAKRCKVHDLIMQGIDHVIVEHGHTEQASRSTTALQHDSAT